MFAVILTSASGLLIPKRVNAVGDNITPVGQDASTGQSGTQSPAKPDTSGCGGIAGYLSMGCWISWLVSWIGTVAGFLIMIVMAILEYALYLNSQIFALPGVQIGWNFTRDIANMGFVLGIIVIAFATILRSQSYGVKQLIVRLIVAAVMVNLSLSVAGVFMDLAGIPTQFFIDKISGATGGPTAMSQTLAAAFNIQNIEKINSNSGTSLGAGKVPTLLASIFFAVIFSFIILVTLIALTGMFLQRFMVLAILIILMPLAILAWVFPVISGNWNKWASKFFQWTFFAPLALFFLYLAVYTIRVQGNYITVAAQTLHEIPLNPSSAIDQTLQIGTDNPTLLIANMVLMILMTLGGLFAAQQMGISAANAAMKIATSGAKGILAYGTYKPAAAVGGYAGRYAKDRAVSMGTKTDTKGQTTTWAQRRMTNLTSLPVIGRAFRGAAERVGKIGEDLKKRTEERQKDLGGITNEDLLRRINTSTSAKNVLELAAELKEASKRKITAQIDPKPLEQAINAAKRTNIYKDIVQTRPDLVEPEQEVIDPRAPGGKRMETKNEAIARQTGKVRSNDIDNMESVVFENAAFVREMSSSMLDRAARREREVRHSIRVTLEAEAMNAFLNPGLYTPEQLANITNLNAQLHANPNFAV